MAWPWVNGRGLNVTLQVAIIEGAIGTSMGQLFWLSALPE